LGQEVIQLILFVKFKERYPDLQERQLFCEIIHVKQGSKHAMQVLFIDTVESGHDATHI
jgi:hypothetical protein